MTGHVLFRDDHLAAVRVHGDVVYLERSAPGLPATVFRIAPGQPPQAVAELDAGRPRGVVQGVEDDALICLEPEGTLAAISMRDGRRRVLRRLDPAPVAVAITPDHVVWCSSDTRELDGSFGPPQTGEVWRWRRGGDRAERLGEHGSFRPDLVAAPAPAPEVFVGAGKRLGVVDEAGLRWLAHEYQGVQHLACGDGVVFYTTHDRVKRLARGEATIVWRATIPLSLAAYGRTLVVGRSMVFDRRALVEQSAVIAVDPDTGSGAVLGLDTGNPAALAACRRGVLAIEEPWLDDDRRSCLVLYPWDTPPVAVLRGPPAIDPEAWRYPLVIQWWRPDGRGGAFQLGGDGAWSCAAGDPAAAGMLDPSVRPALLAAVQLWRDDTAYVGTGWVDLPQRRGWLVAWGEHAWYRAVGDRRSEAAQAVERLLELLAPACPPLAAVAREGF